ncbi:type II secretion system GspH family protein [Patescibacteria group bacterium]|nr:type II secretion system GspH family protein [Patescibacteria group bacterium]MBU4452983.1 type II secretion system GspH family protein [Patescibacteria group bacterium]MCG2687183.1 type II secretion system GspH family protein [Candidatus Parcubacteria bacterium]
MLHKKGFTLLEIVIVIGILLMLMTIIFSSVRIANDSLRAKTHQEIYTQLLSASRRARDGAYNSDWGLYFSNDPITHEAESLTLYAGENYATRDTQYDLVTEIDSSIIFSNITLVDVNPFTGNGNEVTFEAFSGDPHQVGSMTLTTGTRQTIISLDSTGVPLITYVQ